MTTPEAKADRLTAALRDNTHALHSVRRRYRWSLVLTMLLALSLGYSVYANHQNDVSSCESANNIRIDLNDKFSSVGDFLDRLSTDSPQVDELIVIVTDEFPIRDCSDVEWFK